MKTATKITITALGVAALLLCFAFARSQSLPMVDSVDTYINALNWESFALTGTYVPRLFLGEDAQRLIEIKDKSKIKKLIASLADSQKTVVVHQILTNILEPDKDHFEMTYKYGKDSKIKGCSYSYNGLQWSTDSLGKKSISQEEINKIEHYWQKRTIHSAARAPDSPAQPSTSDNSPSPAP